MNVLPAMAAVSVMVTVLLFFIMLHEMVMEKKDRKVRRRLDHVVNRAPLAGSFVSSALRRTELSRFSFIADLLSGKEWVDSVARDLERADLKLRVGEYLSLRVAAALVLFAAVLVLMGSGGVNLVIALGVGAVGYMLPKFYLSRRIESRLSKFNDQLVEALGLVSNSLRSGFGLLQSLDLAAEQLAPPLATEFKQTINDVNVGASFEEALIALNDRVKSNDLDIVVTAILIQRTVGGNLAEVLDTVAHTMRERARIKGEIRTLTAQQRMSGYIVGGLPVAIIGILTLVGSMMGESYVASLFTTNAGRIALVAAGVLEGMGILLIRRILKIEV
ncbi:MAG: type II secretion system F family protein [Dehalococcoidia bacterium]|nr:type II secretion system F family protein [Dehalococcoidia bacterium]